ncbi:RING-H2 finger protein ATL13-like [Musa acuminata AAA Group]|uniref:RING-H2 finger protein ATL13-like n=1 Tax=Musa acuminata AAA Group TaxID=214697 RepID=UPI0031CDFD16
MNLALHASMKQGSLLSPVSLPLPSFTPTPPPPPPPPPTIVNFENRISPSILLIIVILAVIFFISGLLHLLVRYLLRPNNREPDAMSNATALQGELQQLFHLHDAGVDQSFIDTLPVFQYTSIVGLKDPFDCAVCLCEFEADDKLRLLPKCSHAFHVQCIDTWLLSHSTCPLCRRSLLSDFSPTMSCSPTFLVLETGSDSSRESVSTANLGVSGETDFETSIDETSQKPVEVAAVPVSEFAEAKVVPVKLGKLRSVDVGEGEGQATTSGNSNLDQRRCFSMGSYEYMMDESTSLRVTIKPTKKKPSLKNPGHRVAMSECDCHSAREGFQVFDALRNAEFGTGDGNANLHRKESFSVSKIYLRSGKDEPIAEDGSRRASSFRLPLHLERDEIKLKKSNESYSDVEAGNCNSHVVSRLDETPSFARRTLLWIVGNRTR